MAKIKQLNRKSAKMVLEAIDDAIASAVSPFGLAVERKPGRFTRNEIRFGSVVRIGDVGEDGEVESVERTVYRENCKRYGLKEEWLGEHFWWEGDRYVVTGLCTRRHKYPVNVTRKGKNYKLSPDMVIVGFQKSRGEL